MIELRHVRKRFFAGTANEVAALRDIDLAFDDGEWTTVIGSNGAGKTTLLKVVAGIVVPDRGDILLDGTRVTRWADHRRARLIGRIDQDPMASTAPGMSIAENLAMAVKRGQRRGLRRGVTQARRQRFRDALQGVGMGLEGRLDARVSTLSGGQRQGLAVLMATIAEPRLLLLDEHVAALDPNATLQVLRLTQAAIEDRGLTTLMVTHNMEHAIQFGTRLLMMHRGDVILDVRGEEKRALTVRELVQRFRAVSGQTFADDRALLI
ncbi:MAG: ABC transporter ATP-binding protein [Solirubrobacteraceae bacterium]